MNDDNNIGGGNTQGGMLDQNRQLVEALNHAFDMDPAAMHTLIVNRVPVNETLAQHAFVLCERLPVKTNEGTGEAHCAGALGLLNGALNAMGIPAVAPKWSMPDAQGKRRLLGFTKFAG